MKKFYFLFVLLICSFFIFFASAPVSSVNIWGPATPTSIPLILAAENLPNTKITIFTDHSQASALFLNGETQILFTGLDVGLAFYKNKTPVSIINSHVTGLTYLVTYGKKVSSFKDLKGSSIYIPFEGSPIEEIIRYFVSKEGLEWKKDISPIYAPFASSFELLKQGKALAVALPEPFVSQAQGIPNLYVSFSFKDMYEKWTGKKNGYPQVGGFVMKNWAALNLDYIKQLNNELAKAIELVKTNPSLAVQKTASYFKFPQPILLKALGNTSFELWYSQKLLDEIYEYYKNIGSPLDAEYQNFFFIY
ncbi:MAG: ABC transporter substrate-binding protein [Spirochaetes bacterium]|nr:ABC transporter substrate-binding protein [Spirochaetota bacterium]MBP8991433.1 ABC transporter substrate-binding protein [Spirochaetota bacterium]HOV46081.1 hypothetical protein [Exilispira sp.]